MSTLIQEASELHELGLAVHWLKPKSKAPVKAGWSEGKRDTWKTLEREYQPGMGLGVRLGEPSPLGDLGFLAVIDIDVKSTDPRHRKEAYACVRKLFPGLLEKKGPRVLTGRGNGSAHVYVRTRTPVQSRKLGGSPDEVEVLSPTSPINRSQRERLSAEKLAKGVRLKKAWEVEIMSAGKQVVLPPTRHADTRVAYAWKYPLSNLADLPRVKPPKLPEGEASPRGIQTNASDWRFTPSDVDLESFRISAKAKAMLVEGEGVVDRSAALMSVALSLVSAGASDNDVLTILTDRSYYLGDVAFEHRKTGSRKAAAAWIKDYTLRKAKRELDAARVFSDEVVETPPLTKKERKKQERAILGPENKRWLKKLDRTKETKDGGGAVKATLNNVIAILQNTVCADVFKRDAFAARDHYGCDTPWGGVDGEAITDDDAVNIKVWLSREWGIEPTVNIVFEAISHIVSANTYHPVREYLGTLEWDGTPRVDTWLRDYCGAEGPEPYLSDVSRKTLLAAVTRIHEPGAKFDHMLILEGKQGFGKSTLSEILAMDKWFLANLPNLADKDAALNLLGQWFVEMPELANFKRSELETIKAFVSRRIDKVRPPYGRKVLELRRQCIFIGTTNASFYLIDKTGNRRYWPVVVTRMVDFKGLRDVRDQLFAEAMWIYRNAPEPLWLDSEESKVQSEHVQASKTHEDVENVMEDEFRLFMRDQAKADGEEKFDLTRFSIGDLFSMTGPFAGYRADVQNLHTAGRILRKMKFERKKTKRGNHWSAPA